MNLTDREKEIIIESIKQNKSIPKEYIYKMHEDEEDVFLFWNGRKEDITNVALPFHHIEHIDEPRKEGASLDTGTLFDFKGRQKQGWHNKLIWGDNNLILSSLANGAMREEIEKEGGLKLVYIDPPFAVGADFSHRIDINGETATKQQNILEEIAYRDTWQKGISSYLAMMHQRLKLIHNLLHPQGSLFIHCDGRVNSHLRILIEDIYGSSIRAQIAWKKTTKTTSFNNFGSEYDSIIYITKDPDSYKFTQTFKPLKESELITKYVYLEKPNGEIIKLNSDQKKGKQALPKGRRFRGVPLLNMNKNRPNLRYEFLGHTQVWATKKENLLKLFDEGKIFQIGDGLPQKKGYLDENKGTKVNDFWDDINPVNSQAKEKVNYPTQKPEKLLKRIIESCSEEGDLVADFFCGSGTTAVVAEKLNRKWIATDLGRFSIHTTRKRLIGVQRELKENGQDFRAFELLNLGKYERQFFIDDLKNGIRKQKQEVYLELICKAYSARRADGYSTLHAKKASRFVHIGPLDMPVTQSRVQNVFDECKKNLITQVDVLGFEFEMGLQPRINQEFKDQGVDIRLRYIPKDVFDARAVEKGQVKFYNVSYLQAKAIQDAKKVKIELTDFVSSYTQDDIEEIQEKMRKGSKVVIENGQIVKVIKDKNGIINREILTENWHDWIDYWSVDFDYDSKKEIIRVKNEQGEIEEQWTGNYIFENEWQSFRTKQDKTLEFMSAENEYAKKGKYRVMVKVVDILGIDTSQIIEINI